jgi:hypothetical protein
MLFKELFDQNWYKSQSVDAKLVKPSEPNDPRKYQVMQYTGLKDNSGKEIYESDILSFDNKVWGGKITKHFLIEWKDNSACFIGVGVPSDWKIHCEVIGNIYENPELLTKGQ